MRKSIVLSAISIMALAMAPALGQAAADAYPVRPIHLVVPYAPGGSTDVLARLVAQEMSKRLSQSVVVQNRSGAGTIIGTGYVSKAAADGYTLLMGVNTSISSNPLLFKKLPYKVDDFRAVALIGLMPMVLSVSKNNPANSVQELVAASASKKGGLSFATLGTGSSVHLMAELIASKTGMSITSIPYPGSGPALNALIAADVDLYGDALATSLPLIKGNRIKPIAISSKQRSALLPEVPTFEEAGVKDGTIHVWFGVMVPKDTPDNIVKTLNTAINDSIQSPELQSRLKAEGTLTESLSPEQFQAVIDRETEAWARIIKSSNIQLD